MDENNITDVVIVWTLIEGVPNVRTVLCRSEQIVDYTMFPEQHRENFHEELQYECILNPLRNRFTLSNRPKFMLLERSVKYNAWEYPSSASRAVDYRFHLVEDHGLEVDLRTADEKIGHRVFEAPAWQSVKTLLQEKDAGEFKLKHPHFLGLRHLKHHFCEASKPVLAKAPMPA